MRHILGPTQTRPPRANSEPSAPLDPQLFSRIETTRKSLRGRLTERKIFPARVAQWLKISPNTAQRASARAESQIPDKTAAPFRRFAIDVSAESSLGVSSRRNIARYPYALYEQTNNPSALIAALKNYRAARDHWRNWQK